MTSNHEEYSNGINLENLKCLVQLSWGCTYLYRKSNRGTWWSHRKGRSLPLSVSISLGN